MQKVHEVIVFLLSLPLALYYYVCHICEDVALKNQKLRDKLFMRRFNLIDQKHVDDFIAWNNSYHRYRGK